VFTVLHTWDHRVADGQKDLHWALTKAGVNSVQAVRVLETTGEHRPPPQTFALRSVPWDASTRSVLRRFQARLWRLSWLRFERFVARQASASRPDVLHAHFGTTGWKISALAERRRIPLVVSFYGVDVSQIIRDTRWRRRYRALFRRASRLVVLCDAAAERLTRLGCPPAKVRVWNHPLDLDAYRFEYKAPSGPTRLIIAARFVEKKGYPFLLQAFADLVRGGRDLTLTAVGYGPGRRHIEEYAAQLGLGARFRVVDTTGVRHFDTFYNDLLRQHDIFVLPSTTARSGDDEGGPALSLVLAQAAGLPVICTPFAGAERSVIDDETGLLCRQDDKDSLAERIAFLIDHPELGARLAERANRLVRGAFGLEGQAAGMLDIYHDAVHAGPRPETLPTRVDTCQTQS
jgi:colanic acid/amylovoran biosynthesis glycosyltransferase